jgi:xanthine dehydrogenase molybdopterin-binding subunit B
MFQDIPGVVAFLSAKDIPGKNSFIPSGLALDFFEDDEEVSLICSYKRG